MRSVEDAVETDVAEAVDGPDVAVLEIAPEAPVAVDEGVVQAANFLARRSITWAVSIVSRGADAHRDESSDRYR